MPEDNTGLSASRRSEKAMAAIDLYVGSGFGGDYQRAEKIASNLDRDAASDLVDTVADILEAADDAEMRDVYPDVEPRVARNRLDNVDRMLQRQRLQRHFSDDSDDRAALETHESGAELQKWIDDADSAARNLDVSDGTSADDAAVKDEPPSVVSFVSDILIGAIMLIAGLFVTTLVIMVLYQAIMRRREKSKAVQGRSSKRVDQAVSADASVLSPTSVDRESSK